jgi:hypothetical protein
VGKPPLVALLALLALVVALLVALLAWVGGAAATNWGLRRRDSIS